MTEGDGWSLTQADLDRLVAEKNDLVRRNWELLREKDQIEARAKKVTEERQTLLRKLRLLAHDLEELREQGVFGWDAVPISVRVQEIIEEAREE